MNGNNIYNNKTSSSPPLWQRFGPIIRLWPPCWRGFETTEFYEVNDISPTPNPQPGEPGYLCPAPRLNFPLLIGYKMYLGSEFSWTFLAGTEKQSYQFFYLFILVPLTQHNHHSAHILFFTCGMCFSNPTGRNCTHVSIKRPKYVFCQNLVHKSS
jgi:hypothetical protein